VGNIMLRSDLAAESGELPPLPLHAAVADTQGAMGYMIQQCLSNALWESGMQVPVVTVVTQVIVDENDDAFSQPTKPIGAFYAEDRLDELRKRDWVLMQDPQGRGWRRVVASPEPLEIVEAPVVRTLLQTGMIVIACGGGGIPVVAGEAGSLLGVDAVIDKDLASALLAKSLHAAVFVVLTDVERVCLDYGTDHEEGIDVISTSALRRHHRRGQFPAGSMGPKVAAALSFVESEGGRSIITSPECLADALSGRAGTHVVSNPQDHAA
jgi:carbamate kinase